MFSIAVWVVSHQALRANKLSMRKSCTSRPFIQTRAISRMFSDGWAFKCPAACWSPAPCCNSIAPFRPLSFGNGSINRSTHWSIIPIGMPILRWPSRNWAYHMFRPRRVPWLRPLDAKTTGRNGLAHSCRYSSFVFQVSPMYNLIHHSSIRRPTIALRAICRCSRRQLRQHSIDATKWASRRNRCAGRKWECRWQEPCGCCKGHFSSCILTNSDGCTGNAVAAGHHGAFGAR